jgi:thioredoxin reductase
VSPRDLASIDGKTPVPSAHVPVMVIGGGAAGLSAAIAVAQPGIAVMLVEEQPVATGTMSLDVPLFFGQRMVASHSHARMMQQILETDPRIAEAYELGIDVQLGVCAWGIFPGLVTSAGATTNAGPATGAEAAVGAPLLVGLADEQRSWFISCDRLIVAAGARDLCLGFPGWEKPGVLGVQGALQLIERYDAFTGSTLLVLGAGALGVRVAELAAAKGLSVAGVVDIDPVPAAEHARRFKELGVPLYAGHVIQEARGTTEVNSAVLVALDSVQRPLEGSQKTVTCDSIVLAIGAVPNVELLDSLNCQLEFVASKGGWVPRLDANRATSVKSVYAVGDCAGLGGNAVDEGQRVARAVAASLEGTPVVSELMPSPPTVAADSGVLRLRAWMQAQIQASGLDVTICQCEEVTRREIVELRAPRYVPAHGSSPCARSLHALAAEGPLNQDQVKRLTRAGMGPCQGRRCREQVQALLEQVVDCAPGAVPLARYRPPVRPLPLSVLAADAEPAPLRDHWVAWFNISTQWLAHWEPKPVPLADAGRAPEPGEGE